MEAEPSIEQLQQLCEELESFPSIELEMRPRDANVLAMCLRYVAEDPQVPQEFIQSLRYLAKQISQAIGQYSPQLETYLNKGWGVPVPEDLAPKHDGGCKLSDLSRPRKDCLIGQSMTLNHAVKMLLTITNLPEELIHRSLAELTYEQLNDMSEEEIDQLLATMDKEIEKPRDDPGTYVIKMPCTNQD